MPNYALITGASSGIGRELARVCAADGYNLVVVARNQKALEELAAELRVAHKIEVIVYPVDLTATNSVQDLYQYLQQRKLEMEILINNAGFGDNSPMVTADWEKLESMIALNITALTNLSRLYVRDMKKRGSGKILNLASLAAWLPGPNMAVYYASKHYVLALSESLAEELRGSGVSVTTLCPGPIKTGFAARAKAAKTPAFNRRLPSPAAVAVHGYRAMQRGQVIAIYPLSSRVLAFATRLMPRRLLRGLVKKAQRLPVER